MFRCQVRQARAQTRLLVWFPLLFSRPRVQPARIRPGTVYNTLHPIEPSYSTGSNNVCYMGQQVWVWFSAVVNDPTVVGRRTWHLGLPHSTNGNQHHTHSTHLAAHAVRLGHRRRIELTAAATRLGWLSEAPYSAFNSCRHQSVTANTLELGQ